METAIPVLSIQFFGGLIGAVGAGLSAAVVLLWIHFSRDR